jgi:APA family basic amino acid/polyamine antiporter
MENGYKGKLNLYDAVMMVCGSMIGSGVFIVAADMTRILHYPMWVIGCWAIAGIITLLAALCYSELAAMMPEAGGQYVYIRRAFGTATAFTYGWSVFMVIQTGVIAAVAVAFSKYLGVLIPHVDRPIFSIPSLGVWTYADTAALLLIWGLSGIQMLGMHYGKLIQRVFTGIKILALLGIISIGIWYFVFGSVSHTVFTSTSNTETFSSIQLFGMFSMALIGALFSSDAWNNITFMAGDIQRPKRNLPLALGVGVALVTLLYILCNTVYFWVLSPSEIAHAPQDRVATLVLHHILGPSAVGVMALLIVISTLGCNNGLIFGGARMIQAMAREGLFFKFIATDNPRGMPARAMILQASWASVLALSGSYGSLLDYCTVTSLLFYAVTVIALMRLRWIAPQAHRPFKTPGYPVIPILYLLIVALIVGFLSYEKPVQVGFGLGLTAIGIPVYALIIKRQVKC